MSPASRSPKAFLCHSSADKILVERLARDLLGRGVDVFFDKWDIRPGDSLRRKIDEGLESASHFLALLSASSVTSEWVQTELDAGLVQRIERHCKLIPVLIDIPNERVPALLRAMRWVRLTEENFGSGVDELANACLGITDKPTIGIPPAIIDNPAIDRLRLSPLAAEVFRLLCVRSKHGREFDPMLRGETLLEELGASEQDLALAVDDLDDIGLAAVERGAGTFELGFRYVSPTPALFEQADPIFMGWNVEEDAKAVAAALINTGDSAGVPEMASQLGWEARRMNPTLEYLVKHRIVEAYDVQTGPSYFRHISIHVTPRTRRFAGG